MLNMEHPWWEFVVRAAIVYFVLLLLVRASGKRTIGQFTAFDLLVVLLLSESVGDSLGAGEPTLPGGLIAATTLVMLNLGIGFLTSRSSKAAQLVDGGPVLIARDGDLLLDALRRHRLGREEWERALREADATMEEVGFAFLEHDGHISILKRRQNEGAAAAR